MSKKDFYCETRRHTLMTNRGNFDSEQLPEHYNRWLTDNIQNYIKNIGDKIKFLFKPYEIFYKMSSELFGLTRSFLFDQRASRNAKKIIAKSVLNNMRISLKKKVQEWIRKHPDLEEPLLKAQQDIIGFISDYEIKFNPKPKPNSHIYDHHPNFKVDYFSEIFRKEQARLLGFLLADGCIAIQHTMYRDYYRIIVVLQRGDEQVLHDLCRELGLNPEYIYPFNTPCSFTNKEYPMSQVRWMSNDMAKDLERLGMEYKFDDKKGHRVKVPKLVDLGSEELMLSLLFGIYEGDGSLGLVKDENGDIKHIVPKIISSSREFLSQIKRYFGLPYKITLQVTEVYDYKKEMMIKGKVHKLYLGTELFKKMLKTYKGGLKRKRESFEFLEKYGVSDVRRWLMKVLPKDKLQRMLEFLSPKFIAETLSVNRGSIIRLAKEYGIEIKQGGYYKSIQQLIRYRGKSYQYYEEFHYWLNSLGELGKFKRSI